MPFCRLLHRAATLLIVVVLLSTSSSRPISAQSSESSFSVADAMRMRDAGDLHGAVRRLREHLAQHPADGDARRTLAQTLYWIKDVPAARTLYEEGLALHPDDWTLRLHYGRLLLETGDASRARAVLEPLTHVPAVRGQAEALLGALAYWSGDLTTARRRLTSALQTDAALEEARRQLREIETLTAPWLRIGAELRHDDQPLDAVIGDVRAGWHATPLLALTARAQPGRLAGADAPAVTLAGGELGLSHYAPSLRLETEVAGGVLQRSFGPGSDWTGRAGLGLRLPGHVTARAHVARAPYLYTTASLITPVMTETMGGTLHWSHPRGWLGEAAARQERYPDANVVSTAYAWLLAPVARGAAGELQVGYSFAAQDARENRFVRAQPGGGAGGGLLPAAEASGRYEPYYTPENVQSHSALVAAMLRPSHGVELRAGGAYGVRASEDAPIFVATTPVSAPQLAFYRRTFTPWNVRGSLGADVSQSLRVTAAAEHGRTAFYAATTAGVHLTYRFTAGPRGRLP